MAGLGNEGATVVGWVVSELDEVAEKGVWQAFKELISAGAEKLGDGVAWLEKLPEMLWEQLKSGWQDLLASAVGKATVSLLEKLVPGVGALSAIYQGVKFVLSLAGTAGQLLGAVKDSLLAAVNGGAVGKIADIVAAALRTVLGGLFKALLAALGLDKIPGQIRDAKDKAKTWLLEEVTKLAAYLAKPAKAFVAKLKGLTGGKEPVDAAHVDGADIWAEEIDGKLKLKIRYNPTETVSDELKDLEERHLDVWRQIGGLSLQQGKADKSAQKKLGEDVRVCRRGHWRLGREIARKQKEIDKGGGAAKGVTHEKAAAKGYAGIKMTPNGLGPDFAGTKYLKTDLLPGQKNIVKIRLRGSRPADFKEANRLAGFAKFGAQPPDGYAWRRLQDYNPATGEATMQLVDDAAHLATYTHKGSVYQWEQAHPESSMDRRKPLRGDPKSLEVNNDTVFRYISERGKTRLVPMTWQRWSDFLASSSPRTSGGTT